MSNVKFTKKATIDERKTQAEIKEKQSFLSSTDWYATRASETGIEIPSEIKAERQAARNVISQLRAELESKEEKR